MESKIEQLKHLTAELSHRIIRLQLWMISCTQLVEDFKYNKSMHQHIDKLFKSLSEDDDTPFEELLIAIIAIDNYMLELFKKLMEADQQKRS